MARATRSRAATRLSGQFLKQDFDFVLRKAARRPWAAIKNIVMDSERQFLRICNTLLQVRARLVRLGLNIDRHENGGVHIPIQTFKTRHALHEISIAQPNVTGSPILTALLKEKARRDKIRASRY